MGPTKYIIIAVVIIIICVILGLYVVDKKAKEKLSEASKEARRLKEEAERDAEQKRKKLY